MHCRKHLQKMFRDNKKRIEIRKRQELCINCGIRPQFWGVRCVLCRRYFLKNPDALPAGVKRALRLYRDAERKAAIEQTELRARFAIRKLLASGDVSGDWAKALRLYAGLDTGRWRTYQEVGDLMHLSKERVRQLLYPSKVVLGEMLGGDLPWRPLSLKAPASPAEKSWRRARPFKPSQKTFRSATVKNAEPQTVRKQGVHSHV